MAAKELLMRPGRRVLEGLKSLATLLLVVAVLLVPILLFGYVAVWAGLLALVGIGVLFVMYVLDEPAGQTKCAKCGHKKNQHDVVRIEFYPYPERCVGQVFKYPSGSEWVTCNCLKYVPPESS